MLYAYFLVSFLDENVSILEQGDLGGSLPLAISSVYHSYFKRLENELRKELDVKEEDFLNLLSAVTASREPLPIGFASKVLVPNTYSPLARRKVLKAIGSVSSLLPIRDGCVHVIHKSVKDWLTDTSCYGEHVFTVDEKEGHRILASLCVDELDDLKEKGVRDTQFSSTEKYALHHGARHVLQLDDNTRPGGCSLERCVQRYVIDLELVYAKLYVSFSIAAEDILWLQRQEISQLLSDDSKSFLDTLLSLLRKYHYIFTSHPRVFFQTVLTEGGRVLSSQASNIFKNKYPEIPYMEYVHKAVQQGAVQARFQCSSLVACFDVSPKLDFMVCECKDGTIHLWSLNTGKLVWSRPVMIIKSYRLVHGAYRKLPSSPVFSFYRSVVFHPTKDAILPGVLSQAIMFDGDLKPLFPESKCSFTVCSISGDKTKMLTDCPDDAKCIIMWSLKNGSEMTRITRNEDVLSFAWSRDGKLLAISHSTGSICFVDVMDWCIILAQTATPEVCGMIKFSPDCQSLFCWHKPLNELSQTLYRLNIDMAKHPSLWQDVLVGASYVPWKFESCSDGGFLLGDPLSSLFERSSPGFFDWAFDFVLNKQTVLRGYPHDVFVDMLNISELRKTDEETTFSSIEEIAFSLSGEIVYDVVSDADKPKVRAWNVSSGRLTAEKSIPGSLNFPWFIQATDSIVAMKEGILLTRDNLELWNLDLSKRDRCWTDINGIRRMIPISEERVACVHVKWFHDIKVIILDTSSGKIVSTIPTGGRSFVSCNSKCQLLTMGECFKNSLYLSDNKTTIWIRRLSFPQLSFYTPPGMFSLAETFVVIWAHLPERGGQGMYVPKRDGQGMYVLDAVSGKTLHILCRGDDFFDCKFVSDEECVINSKATSSGSCLRMFNVKSGDLLSVIGLDGGASCLAACPRKRLLAIEQRDSKHGFKLIQVWLPQDKDSRKSKRCVLNKQSRNFISQYL